ncbi:DUF7848 domain-containing protein [Streptomyces sp. SP17KL33]|uniref:DUF7848 domain-containing protein n=1 Tax=Streptomyces sp. SP17KL33 TaxID=3002534 RepID=UPI002E77DB11|nr:hypothetical protein [Streptomyces sp. SP17KL33]MEE1835786.1 hypothetical protein [Streptomyces sp. SP17KL33]
MTAPTEHENDHQALTRRADELGAAIESHLGGAMTTRKKYRFREYTIMPDIDRADAEPTTFHMQCKADDCSAISEMSRLATDGTAWALAHLKGNPTHLEFREVITRPYVAEPGDWQ